ncbi:MAG TPA: SprT family zinc-dependent metalloprotease [Methanoregula sp.]|nr:SprT family zinc-dependent metalloprotease [Methanoregula sp.]
MDTIPVEKIIRSRRRTISLEVTRDATLVVRAPSGAPAAYIEEMIREKSAWIRRKMEEIRRRPAAPAHVYAEGELFLFLGRSYPLHISDDNGRGIERRERLYVPRSFIPDIKCQIRRWYVDEAEKEIKGRCMWFSMATGIVPVSVRISDARQRWGSCTRAGGLNFSWRLIQAPPEIIDYVVVHELAHIPHPDHSKKFWNKVREIMPDFERRREWLRENERLLRI